MDVAEVTSDKWAAAWRKNAKLPEDIRLHLLRELTDTYRVRIEEAHRLSGYECDVYIEVKKRG